MPDRRQTPQQQVSHQLLRERRTLLRFPSSSLQATCRLGAGRTGVHWSATVRDVSAKGISLTLPRPFSPGCVLIVKLHRDQGPVLLTVQARVVFVRNDAGAWLHGCQFLEQIEDTVVERLL